MSLLAALLLTTPPPAEHALPGIRYEVLEAGPVSGAHPTRADDVDVRYVGQLTDGTTFSASPDGGRQPMTFAVQRLIPGFMAALLLMRPGDRWRVTLPPYLAYGATGRRLGPQASTMQSHDIPPEATLIFDIELVAVRPARP